MKKNPRILISRTDSIGDVVLSLPLAGFLKEKIPGCYILFMGREYTRPVIRACEHVDRYIDGGGLSKLPQAEQLRFFRELEADVIIHVFPRREIARLAKEAGIPLRIGVTGRLYHWLYCNKLIPMTRRRSGKHEALLNLRLLYPLTKAELPLPGEIHRYYGLTQVPPLSMQWKSVLSPDHINLVFHPLSRGSARNWPMEHYVELARMLPEERFRIYVTGTQEEGLEIRSSGIFSIPSVSDLSGRFSLDELLSFLASSDGIVAASTGPLHISAALGNYALGIYPPIRPMHPGRWAPLGEQAHYLVKEGSCSRCRKGGPCACMEEISPRQAADKLLALFNR